MNQQFERRFLGLSGPTIKTALFVGFALICGTWLLAGYFLSLRMSDLQSRSTMVNARYMRAQDLLATARRQVLSGSVYVRDALLDPDPAHVEGYRTKVDAAYRAADESVSRYEPAIDAPEEIDHIARLHAEIDELRSTGFEVFADGTRRRTMAEAGRLLTDRLMPRRERVIRIAEEMEALNSAAFVRQQEVIAALYRTTHHRLWESFGLAVLVSLGIAVLATLYAGRLEDRIRVKQRREIENARDLQRLSSKLMSVQEEERRTIARELHDEIGQALTAIKAQLAVAQRASDANRSIAPALEDARSMTDGALHAVRDLSHLLRPPMLDDLGLLVAIESYVKYFGRRYGLRVEVAQDRLQGRFAPDVETALYRVVQEALTNVARHARATACHVRFERRGDAVLVTVEDDGVGFDVAAAKAGMCEGLGLIGMRERVTALGGKVCIDSAPGAGTRVVVEVAALEKLNAESEVGDASLLPEAVPVHGGLRG